MKIWPIPNSYSNKIPALNSPGSFWENREDRYHCGIDIYAPDGSEVVSTEGGKVVDIGIFTSPEILSYWNLTKYVTIKIKNNFFLKYAELSEVIININQLLKPGQLIGYLGTVLNFKKITKESPRYIQKIKSENKPSMLHLEVYSSKPVENKNYLGGNWFGKIKSENLLDPTDYLK